MRSWTGALPVAPAAPCAPWAPVAPFAPWGPARPGRPGLRLTDIAHRWLTARGGQETAQHSCGTTEILSADYTCHLTPPSWKLLTRVLSTPSDACLSDDHCNSTLAQAPPSDRISPHKGRLFNWGVYLIPPNPRPLPSGEGASSRQPAAPSLKGGGGGRCDHPQGRMLVPKVAYRRTFCQPVGASLPGFPQLPYQAASAPLSRVADCSENSRPPQNGVPNAAFAQVRPPSASCRRDRPRSRAPARRGRPTPLPPAHAAPS